jgi:hypothetical protein
MTILKRSGDVRNSLSIIYGASGNQSYEDEDLSSISLYGELAWVVTTHLQNLSDAKIKQIFTCKLEPSHNMRCQALLIRYKTLK